MNELVRTLRETAATRVLRAELLALAGAVALHPDRRGSLRLLRPRISEERLEEEWEASVRALRPGVLSRLSLQVDFRDGRSRVFGASRGARFEPADGDAGTRPGLLRLPSRELSWVVEKLLIWGWLTGKGPLTRTWLERTAGCSYPTVALVVKRLGAAIRRHPDRRIELDHLPREEWARVFALSGGARSTMRFKDSSGQPSGASGLLRRLRALGPKGVAVGGVAGARRYHPELDLVGLPRLDLSVHAPGREADVGFVRRLDPALQPATDPGDPAQLALHFVRHADPLFTPDPGGLPWADPVECVLDLHEARLEAQALELLDALTSKARG